MNAVGLHDRVESERRSGEQAHHLIDDDIVADRDAPLSDHRDQRLFIDRAVGLLGPEHRDRASALFEIGVELIDLMRIERLLWPRDHDHRGVVGNLGRLREHQLLDRVAFAFEVGFQLAVSG